ncbi:MAG: RNA recognition motif domain-containing protein [Isosphaeraceae bacterium]
MAAGPFCAVPPCWPDLISRGEQEPGTPPRFLAAVIGLFLPWKSVESLFRAIAMAKRLYVGNLKYTVTSAQLQELFEQYGTVNTAQVLSDRETGRSRGFGFVEMQNDDEALAAIESLDGQDYDGRRLTVNEARPRTPGDGGGGYRGGGGGGYRGGGGGGGGGGGYGEY